MDQLDARVLEWRTAILRNRAVDENDADELESHLRDQVADLRVAGLSDDEAFLVAVRRLGEVDGVTAEYAREHSDRLWKQLAMPRADQRPARPLVTMLVFAALAAVAIQVARLVAESSGTLAEWFVRDISLFVLPVLVAYFAVVRRPPLRTLLAVGGGIAVIAVAIALFPFVDPTQFGGVIFGSGVGSATSVLVALHLPVVLWFAVGVVYTGGEVGSASRRMDFIRFTGEWIIYYALIALGGAVLMVLTVLVLTPVAPDAIDEVTTWVLPSGGAAAVVVAAWLVEAKKSIIENLAPVLTAIFTPLFAAMLLAAAVVYLSSGAGRSFDRELLGGFDALLLVVVGLVVYGISAREPGRASGAMDVIRLIAVVAAIVLDVIVLIAMFARVGEFGFTANRVAALGLNIILLVNLAGTAWLIARMLAGRAPVVQLERWQTGYLPVFAVWVTAVALAVPPIFGFA